ncbi:Concanavalin A-like lectin/glucanases superfamily protein [Thermomonospora echinospora]|uniref:Concanavalin A-like lectin/glucanases superfamily protein n=1 Tax=Thermomonospora echinospora TaxID=1992 RepID=A0A1H6DLD7_9ACTN|nr:family 16 glycosylhydrolase [Thermomonospora echinospora]SEG85526.1 Concanavalin A-like lectin/glucanases superfamily protein [Thermomonospora echinospora]
MAGRKGFRWGPFWLPAVLAVCVMSAGVMPAVMLAGTSAPLPPESDQPAGWRLTWADEFDGPAGSAPDADKWVHDLGANGDQGDNPGWGNQELQTYTDSRQNSELTGDGQLSIKARRNQDAALQCPYTPAGGAGTCAFTSARLKTLGKFSQKYGRFEARIKVPKGAGVWPAFWAMGDDGPWPNRGEIDVMEHAGSKPGEVSSAIHSGDAPAGHYLDYKAATLPGGGNFGDDYHVYAVDWFPDHMSFSVDGQVHFTTRKDQAVNTRPDGWYFEQPFYLLLNLAIDSGTFGGPANAATATTPADPAEMLVDYVRVYQAGGQEGGSPEDTKPEDTKPEDPKPEDTKPEDTKPEDTKPKDTDPKDTPEKLPSSPTGAWALNEGAGTGAEDRAGGHTGALSAGVSWVTDPTRGKVARFNGTSGEVIPNTAVVDTTGGFTASAWVKHDGGTGNHTVIGQDGNTISAFFLQYNSVHDDLGPTWAFSMPASDEAHPGWKTVYAPITTPGAWTHLTGVYDAAAKTIKLYVNGVLADTETGVTGWASTGTLTIGRGKYQGRSADHFPGLISNVRTYGTPLTEAQIRASMN